MEGEIIMLGEWLVLANVLFLVNI